MHSATFFVRAFVVGGLLLVAGCSDPPRPKDTRSNDSASRCDDLFATTLDMLEPGRLGLTAEEATAAAMLNDWLEMCSGEKPSDLVPAEGVSGVAGLLPESDRAALTRTRFQERDAAHVRNCILLRDAARFACRDSENDLDRAVDAFYWLVQTVELIPRSSQTVPQTPYQTLLFGKGTVDDFVWVYADMLRQFRIDAVRIQPAGVENPATLMGVLLDGEAYLFDPVLAAPVPAPDAGSESVLVRRPATLAQARADDAIFRRLDVSAENQYRLTADDLAKLSVQIVASPSFWAPPLLVLEEALAGENSTVVFDGLGDLKDGPGLVKRVRAAGSTLWSADDVTVWDYPLRRTSDFENLSPEQSEQFSVLYVPFRAPTPIQVNPAEKKMEVGEPQNLLLKARVWQLRGDLRSAITNYQRLRLDVDDVMLAPIPQPVKYMNGMASMRAFVWVGVCQEQQGDPAAAAETFDGYFRQFGEMEDSPLVIHSKFLRALSLAEAGRNDEAAEELQLLGTQGPFGPRTKLYLERIKPAK